MMDTLIEISQNLASQSHTYISKLSYNHCLQKIFKIWQGKRAYRLEVYLVLQ